MKKTLPILISITGLVAAMILIRSHSDRIAEQAPRSQDQAPVQAELPAEPAFLPVLTSHEEAPQSTRAQLLIIKFAENYRDAKRIPQGSKLRASISQDRFGESATFAPDPSSATIALKNHYDTAAKLRIILEVDAETSPPNAPETGVWFYFDQPKILTSTPSAIELQVRLSAFRYWSPQTIRAHAP